MAQPMITVNGENWENCRPWEGGPDHGTINAKALAPASRAVGYCICLHPMTSLINFAGLICNWCDQPITDDYYGAAAKALRTTAIMEAFPELRR